MPGLSPGLEVESPATPSSRASTQLSSDTALRAQEPGTSALSPSGQDSQSPESDPTPGLSPASLLACGTSGKGALLPAALACTPTQISHWLLPTAHLPREPGKAGPACAPPPAAVGRGASWSTAPTSVSQAPCGVASSRGANQSPPGSSLSWVPALHPTTTAGYAAVTHRAGRAASWATLMTRRAMAGPAPPSPSTHRPV